MILPEHKIKEIVDWLGTGMLVFYHKETGDVLYHPDPDNPYFEPELWQDQIDEIEKDRDKYLKFESMDSRQSFKVMEHFADSLSDLKFKGMLYDRLSRKKPFQNFKMLVESSDYRQDWFDFRDNASIEWMKEQLEGYE
ncbi:MAG: hypothetical protein DSY77_10890 [Bacteroidetes bacterium]|jgi:hypothetical protein|nr:MAG: hypothetical protein DSY77_10890 [Bacteroidota bacterium]